MTVGMNDSDDREVELTNRTWLSRCSSELLPYVRALAFALEDGDAAAARELARAVPTHLRSDAAKDLRYLPLRAGSSRDDGTVVSTEEAQAGRRAYWVAVSALIDGPLDLAFALHEWRGGPYVDAASVAEEIKARPSTWRTSFARALARHSNGATWYLQRRLAEAGLMTQPKPLVPLRILDLPWRDLPEAIAADDQVPALVEALWTSPGVGKRVGRTYSHQMLPPQGWTMAEDRSCYSEEEWSGLLQAWGVADAERRPGAIDACLGALSGAAGDSRADLRGWGLVHGRLDVTVAELAERQTRYLHLASSGATDPARLAREVVMKLQELGLLDPQELLDVTPDALLRPEKGAVQQWLALLSKAVADGTVAGAAAAALIEEALPSLPRGADTQAKAFLSKHGAARTHAAAASEAWIPPLPVDLPTPEPVQSVASMDELVDLLLALKNDTDDAIAAERAIDGMLRLREPDQALVTHLGHSLHGPRGFQRLVRAWLGLDVKPQRYGARTRELRFRSRDEVPAGHDAVAVTRRTSGGHSFETWVSTWEVSAWTPGELTAARLAELEGLLRFPEVGSLSLPTSLHGDIDTATLRRRLRERAQQGALPGPHELASALIRLTPEGRTEIFRSGLLSSRYGPWENMLSGSHNFRLAATSPTRYEYGGSITVGPLTLWLRADDEYIGAEGDPLSWWLDPQTGIDHWDVDGHRPFVEAKGASWVLTQLPWHPEVAAAHLQPEIIVRNENPDADISAAMQQLSRSRAPLGPVAADLLGWAGSYANVRTRAAASEAISRLARHGRLSAVELSRSVLRLVGPESGPFLHVPKGIFIHMHPEPPKLSRIASTFKDASRVNDHGERLVLDAIIHCAPALTEMRGSVALLEIAAEIAERRGIRVDLPEPLAGLAASGSRTRLAEEARRLAGEGRPGARLYAPDPE